MATKMVEQRSLVMLVECGRILYMANPDLQISTVNELHTDMRNAGVDEERARERFFLAKDSRCDYVIWSQATAGERDFILGDSIFEMVKFAVDKYTITTPGQNTLKP